MLFIFNLFSILHCSANPSTFYFIVLINMCLGNIFWWVCNLTFPKDPWIWKSELWFICYFDSPIPITSPLKSPFFAFKPYSNFFSHAIEMLQYSTFFVKSQTFNSQYPRLSVIWIFLSVPTPLCIMHFHFSQFSLVLKFSLIHKKSYSYGHFRTKCKIFTNTFNFKLGLIEI